VADRPDILCSMQYAVQPRARCSTCSMLYEHAARRSTELRSPIYAQMLDAVRPDSRCPLPSALRRRPDLIKSSCHLVYHLLSSSAAQLRYRMLRNRDDMSRRWHDGDLSKCTGSYFYQSSCLSLSIRLNLIRKWQRFTEDRR
jgi:hypothetical protein